MPLLTSVKKRTLQESMLQRLSCIRKAEITSVN